MKCSVCLEFPDVCKKYFQGRVPSICTELGPRCQSIIAWKYHKSAVHKACLNAKQKRELYKAGSVVYPMINAITKANEQLYTHVLTQMFDVYNDAKRGTLSAWSWPSGFLTRFAATRPGTNDKFEPYEPKVDEVQDEVNPSHH